MLVVLITPPPVDEEGRFEYARSLYGEKAMDVPERTNEMAGVYAKQCIEVAKELGVGSIDLWSKMQETEGWQKKFLSVASTALYHLFFLFRERSMVQFQVLRRADEANFDVAK
ncbi:hypothetical protein IFM89_019117 [Coptis chinensis]|uniref:Uncharacterized protein n=1 Tax=Coptis chinensis TaxID=261450 RepID=A0A835LRW2_9MAGN|nr:hypothetical protein IFM89_019117 [Coptis chinensis]